MTTLRTPAWALVGCMLGIASSAAAQSLDYFQLAPTLGIAADAVYERDATERVDLIAAAEQELPDFLKLGLTGSLVLVGEQEVLIGGFSSPGAPDILVLAFAGTDLQSANDVFTNLGGFLLREPTGSFAGGSTRGCSLGILRPIRPCVHPGYYARAVAVFNNTTVRGALNSAMADGRPIIVTGHSLGGAVAQLFGYYAAREGYAIDGVVTYGAPMIGNYQLADAYEAAGLETHRFVIAEDPIPLAPHSIEGFGEWSDAGDWHYLIPEAGGWVADLFREDSIAQDLEDDDLDFATNFNNHDRRLYLEAVSDTAVELLAP